jgi:hypothetical protein
MLALRSFRITDTGFPSVCPAARRKKPAERGNTAGKPVRLPAIFLSVDKTAVFLYNRIIMKEV